MYASETIKTAQGKRKLGASDLGKVQPDFGNILLVKKKIDYYHHISNSPEMNQGNVGSCAHCALASEVQDQIQKIWKNQNFEILWKKSWEEMKKAGLASDSNGSSLQDNLWYATNFGFYGNNGRRYKLSGVKKISNTPEAWKTALVNGYGIYTGLTLGRYLTDSNWVWKPNTGAFGHSVRCVGWNQIETLHKGITIPANCFIMETTWDDFGYKKEGEFFIRETDIGNMMSSYIIQA